MGNPGMVHGVAESDTTKRLDNNNGDKEVRSIRKHLGG